MLYIKKILYKIIKKCLYKKKINKNEYIKIKYSENIKLGHYQIYGLISIMKYYKFDKKKFNTIIVIILKKIKNLYFIDKLYLSNNNYINIFLKINYIEKKLKKMLFSKRLDIVKHESKNIIIDYSSPNMSKEMHIGHLRSIILGDSFLRISEFLGHNVIKINHIGDWGINFGMLIAKIKENNKLNNLSINLLEKLYIKSKIEYKNNIIFKKKSDFYLNQLINNNNNIYNLWKKIINITLKNNQKIYNLLNVKLNFNDILGESFYQKNLSLIVNDLIKKKIAIKKNNSIIVPLKTFKNKYGENMGIVIKKENGNYLYSTVEIASIKYRCKYLFADRLIYYTDIRQKDHLLQSFEISKMAGYINEKIKFEHHYFGMILDKNKIPFKTRDGNSLKLINFIDKYLLETKKFILNKNKILKNDEINKLIKILGIGSLKYTDLSKNRFTNYIINWNKIFSFEGNTLIYIQYSYTRINSIFKKINIKDISNLNFYKKCNIFLKNEEEIEISILLINFEQIIQNVFNYGTPNILCSYIYKLTLLFSNYYNKYKIISTDENTKISRLNLILLISKIIKKGLYLLGIKTINKM